MSDDRDVVVEALAREWDAEPDGIWEPWRPQIGQRVQIALNGECQHATRDIDALTGEVIGPEEKGHPLELHGYTGVVDRIGDPVFSTPSDGHGYCVTLDHELWMDGGPLAGLALAACEMIPVTQEPRERVGLEGDQ